MMDHSSYSTIDGRNLAAEGRAPLFVGEDLDETTQNGQAHAAAPENSPTMPRNFMQSDHRMWFYIDPIFLIVEEQIFWYIGLGWLVCVIVTGAQVCSALFHLDIDFNASLTDLSSLSWSRLERAHFLTRLLADGLSTATFKVEWSCVPFPFVLFVHSKLMMMICGLLNSAELLIHAVELIRHSCTRHAHLGIGRPQR
jgi:hypothetical protein